MRKLMVRTVLGLLIAGGGLVMATPANAQSSLLINYGAYLNGNHSYSIGVANNSPNEGTATVLWADQSQEGLASLQWPVPTGQAFLFMSV